VWWVQGLKRPDLEANHSFLFSAEVKSCGERYLQISIRFHDFRGNVYLYDTTPFVVLIKFCVVVYGKANCMG
jgi:hypothetical protein